MGKAIRLAALEPIAWRAETCVTLWLVSFFFSFQNLLPVSYDLGVEAVALKEILVESMIIPDHMKLEEDA